MNKLAVAIGYLERFAADYERLNGIEPKLPKMAKKNGIKVAAVGSGPSALSFAGATVILAMGDGRRAAAGMDKYLKEKYLK